MKDLEVRDIMHIVNNLIRLHRVQVAKKKCNQSIQQKYLHTEQANVNYVKKKKRI